MVSIRTLFVEEDVERARRPQARLRFRFDGRLDAQHRPTLDSALASPREGDIDFPARSRPSGWALLGGCAPRVLGDGVS